MKEKRPHRVPLTTPALAIGNSEHRQPLHLHQRRQCQDAGQAVNARCLAKLRPDPVTSDGRKATVLGTVRSGFGTWRLEQTTISLEVAEACLAHAKKGQNPEAYQHGAPFEQMRDAMEKWARFVSSPIGDNVTHVTPVRRAS